MTLSEVIVAINAMPMVGKRFNWAADLTTATNTACAIIKAGNTAHTVIWTIYIDTDASRDVLALLSRGCKPNGRVWPELRLAIQARGLTWRPSRRFQKCLKPAAPVAPSVTSPPCTWIIDPETDDILVTTTKRLACGSPEYRQKIREVALQLGAPRT